MSPLDRFSPWSHVVGEAISVSEHKIKRFENIRISPFTPVETKLENGSVFLFSSNFFRKSEQMLQLSLQLEIEYVLIKKGRSTQIIHRKETKMMSSSVPK